MIEYPKMIQVDGKNIIVQNREEEDSYKKPVKKIKSKKNFSPKKINKE